jgi:hypothetical protein
MEGLALGFERAPGAEPGDGARSDATAQRRRAPDQHREARPEVGEHRERGRMRAQHRLDLVATQPLGRQLEALLEARVCGPGDPAAGVIPALRAR